MARLLLLIAALAAVTVTIDAGNPADEQPCWYTGQVYFHGDIWEPTPCSYCECVNSTSVCIIETCPECPGNAEEPADVECCGTCDGEPVEPTETEYCSWRGTTYENGEDFSLNPCTDCQCDDGIAVCAIRSCPYLQCGNYVEIPGTCCPVCAEEDDYSMSASFSGLSFSYDIWGFSPCVYMGEVFLHGQQWEPLPCAHCECRDGDSECTFRTCPPCYGEVKKPKKNECCPRCDGERVEPTVTDFCAWRGLVYEDYEHFTLNPCTDCECVHGVGKCTVRSCPPLPCAEVEPVEGKCCPVCVESLDAGLEAVLDAV